MEFNNIFPASYGSSRVNIPENDGFVRGVGPIDSHEFCCKKLRSYAYASMQFIHSGPCDSKQRTKKENG